MNVTSPILDTPIAIRNDGITAPDLWEYTRDWRATAESIVDEALMRVAALELGQALAIEPSGARA